MNADQRAKFEEWAADADRRDRRRAVGRVDAWEGWCACLAANAIDQPPADDEPCKCGFRKRAADKMAAVLDDWVYRDIIDPRSAAADARLSYGEPFSHEEVNHILGRPLDAPFERSVIGEPSDVEGLREACRDLLAIVADAIIHGMPITPAVADARNRAVAALAKREERG